MGLHNLNEFVNDLIPTGLNGALRGAGSPLFRGNENGASGFVQDDWKIFPRLTLNLGVRYEWNGVPKDDNEQNLNAISNLPGVFRSARRKPITTTSGLASAWLGTPRATGSGRYERVLGFRMTKRHRTSLRSVYLRNLLRSRIHR